MEETKQKRYVSPKETLIYGIANSGQVFGYNLVAGGFLSLFFTKVFEIPPAAVSTMILFLGIWDTVNDPIMGAVVDKTRTRYGKLRPYLLFVPLPLSVTTILLFSGPLLLKDVKTTAVKIVYMYISYFIWEFFYTIGDIPFWGMSAAISPNPADRTRCISSARFISGIFGGLSTTLLVMLMDLSNNHVIGLSLAQVFCLMAVIAGTAGMGLFSLAGIFCKERVVQTVKEPSVLEGFKVMLHNKPLLLIVSGNVIGTLSGLAGVFQTYYFAEVININSLMLLVGLPGTLIGWATYLVIPKLKKRFDNRQIIFLNGFTRITVATAVFLIGFRFYSNVKVILPLLMIRNAIFSFFDTINMVIPTEMIGDTVDYMEWKTGERNEGVSFSVLTFIGKLTGSVSTSVATAILPLIGLAYTTTGGRQVTVKGDHTDVWIWTFYSFIPYVIGVLGVIPYFWYDLTGDKLQTIRTELEERRNAYSEKVTGGDGDE